jgi:hypothetical protein
VQASLAAKLAEAQQVEHLLVTYDRVPAEPTRPDGVPVSSSYCFVGVPGEPRHVKHTMELYMHKPNEYGARPMALLLVWDASQQSYTLVQPQVPLENCDTTELLKRLYPRDKFARESELVGIKAQFQYYQPALQKVRHSGEQICLLRPTNGAGYRPLRRLRLCSHAPSYCGDWGGGGARRVFIADL